MSKKYDVTKLSWVDRFHVIDNLRPTDDAICRVFGVSRYELEAAREVRSGGHLKMASTVNPQAFEELFKMSTKDEVAAVVGSELIANPTVKEPVEVISKESAGEKAKTGPKTSKIYTAFTNIPAEMTNAEAFAQQYGVSIAVLRQHKRFDTTGLGQVHVKKDKASGQLMVWRGIAAE